jgi:hypothetical protein
MPSHHVRIIATVLAASIAAVAASAGPASAAYPLRLKSRTAQTTLLTGTGEVPVAGASGRVGTIRVRLTFPRTWTRAGARRGARATFNSNNSCAHRVTLTARLIIAAAIPAADRAAALTPVAAPNLVHTSGTRDQAAFRVVRIRGTATVTAAFVQPLAPSYSGSLPAGSRLLAEIVATAIADPRRECHAGGPRGVGTALGDAFGGGSLGGFATSG